MRPGILDDVQSYQTSWKEKAVLSFTADDIKEIVSAEVRDSQHGQSVCFVMRSGDMKFVPIDPNCSATTGSQVDLTKAQIVILEKAGHKDIKRVRI